MNIIDYALSQSRGFFSTCHAVLWVLWSYLVKPGRFTVDEPDVVIELRTARGMLPQIGVGLWMMVVGASAVLVGLLGSALLLALLFTAGLWLPVLFLIAGVRHWRNQRRHAALLAKARAGRSSPAQPPFRHPRQAENDPSLGA